MKIEELDIAGKIFGVRRIKREGLGDLIELYVEDDEWWSLKTSFDVFWLDDLIYVCESLKKDSGS